MKYIVLLRGINISGKNKISMNELKSKLEGYNYKNVITYLNSGNIILESNETKDEVVTNIHYLIQNEFKLNIPVFVMTNDELNDLLDNSPKWWDVDNKENYTNVIFILKPHTYEEIQLSLGRLNDSVERIEEYKNSIFWMYKLKDYRKSTWWVKTASSDVKDFITIRTKNTVKKLLELCKGEDYEK